MKYLSRTAMALGATTAALAMASAVQAQTVNGDFANLLQNGAHQGVRYNNLLGYASECEVPSLDGNGVLCDDGAPFKIWGILDYGFTDEDGNVDAPDYYVDTWMGLVGAELDLTTNSIIGVSIGKIGADITALNNNQIETDGYQLGAYVGYDAGAGFYAKLLGSYGWYGADSDRNLPLAVLGGGEFLGDPDYRQFTIGTHFGYRVDLFGATVTPYANLDLVNTDLQSFDEVGPGGSLFVDDGKYEATFGTAGVQFASDIGGIVAAADIGYRAVIEGDDQAFAGGDFTGLSGGRDDGQLLAGISFGGQVGPLDVRVGYEGLFSAVRDTQAGTFRVRLPIGRDEPVYVAPPAPPAPPVNVPPPPAETITCPDGTVILATERCPPPPPAPTPPPPPIVQERG